MSRCSRCGKEYSGSRVHCSVCHETFKTYTAANYHWGDGTRSYAPRYDAPHLHPSESPFLERGLDGVWHVIGRRP